MGFEKNHVKSVHEGQKFQCPHCEHNANQKSSIQRHIKSVHEGQKFQCPECEHKATKKGNLQTHIKSVHEGKKFQCPHCKYKVIEYRFHIGTSPLYFGGLPYAAAQVHSQPSSAIVVAF